MIIRPLQRLVKGLVSSDKLYLEEETTSLQWDVKRSPIEGVVLYSGVSYSRGEKLMVPDMKISADLSVHNGDYITVILGHRWYHSQHLVSTSHFSDALVSVNRSGYNTDASLVNYVFIRGPYKRSLAIENTLSAQHLQFKFSDGTYIIVHTAYKDGLIRDPKCSVDKTSKRLILGSLEGTSVITVLIPEKKFIDIGAQYLIPKKGLSVNHDSLILSGV